MLHFKLYRGEIGIAGMEVLSVVEDFDGVEDGEGALISGSIHTVGKMNGHLLIAEVANVGATAIIFFFNSPIFNSLHDHMLQ